MVNVVGNGYGGTSPKPAQDCLDLIQLFYLQLWVNNADWYIQTWCGNRFNREKNLNLKLLLLPAID